MQFIPIIPRAGKLLEDWLEVRRLAAVRAARAVEPRTLPPQLILHHPAQRPAEEPHSERRMEPLEERRRYCRRMRKLPVLEELRSAMDRRKRRQRSSDAVQHIDEQA